jgi:hypothetical protein
MFVFDEFANAMYIMRRIASRECDPEKIIEVSGCELAVINNRNQRKTL